MTNNKAFKCSVFCCYFHRTHPSFLQAVLNRGGHISRNILEKNESGSFQCVLSRNHEKRKNIADPKRDADFEGVGKKFIQCRFCLM